MDSSRHRASNILNMRIFIDSSSFPARGIAPRARCVLGLGVLGHGGLVDLQLRRLQGQERLPFQHFWYFCAPNSGFCGVVYKDTGEGGFPASNGAQRRGSNSPLVLGVTAYRTDSPAALLYTL